MTKTYTGGCACGAIRYETTSEPIFENHCQCRDCQKRSGTGHGSYLTFPQRADVTITGEANTWRVAGDSGSARILDAVGRSACISSGQQCAAGSRLWQACRAD